MVITGRAADPCHTHQEALDGSTVLVQDLPFSNHSEAHTLSQCTTCTVCLVFQLPSTSPGSGGAGVASATGNLISLSPDHTHQTSSRYYTPSHVFDIYTPPLSLPLSSRPLSAESIELESAVLSPSHDTLLSDLFQQPAELTSLHTSPIPMPPHPSSHSKEHGTDSGSHSMERGKVTPHPARPDHDGGLPAHTGVVEVYGSWNKMAPRLEATHLKDVEQRLAEAMGDHTSSHQPQITMATQKSIRTKTGFQTASDDQPV